MHQIARNLDHVGTIVGNLDRGRSAFEKLGFTLTARSQHRGSVVPGGPVQLFGQANHCAMLKQGYLEVLGIVDYSLPTPASLYLEKYEGPHIVAFRPSSIDRVLELSRHPGLLDPPRALGRTVVFGPSGDQQREVKFTNVQFQPGSFPEATFIYTDHLTRETMWQPHLLAHENGAIALQRVYISCADPAPLASRLGEVLGMDAQAVGPGCRVFEFESSSLALVTPQEWTRLYPGAVAPESTRPVGYIVRTESVDVAVDVLSRNNVPYQRAPSGGVFISPEHACGNVLHFNEKD